MTFWITLMGTLLFFFIFILDDQVRSENIRQFELVKYFLIYFFLQFFLTYIPRVIITTIINHKISKGLIGFNTIIVGSDKIALQTYLNITKQQKSIEKYIVGYVTVPDETDQSLSSKLPCLGKMEDLTDLKQTYIS